jgi:hypothetical protein
VVATNECPCEWEQATFPLTESFFTKTIPPTPTPPLGTAPFQKETKTLSLCPPPKKTWHHNPEFGHARGEIKKPAKKTLAFNEGEIEEKTSNLVAN